jgi:hypothetical protein
VRVGAEATPVKALQQLSSFILFFVVNFRLPTLQLVFLKKSFGLLPISVGHHFFFQQHRVSIVVKSVSRSSFFGKVGFGGSLLLKYIGVFLLFVCAISVSLLV